VPLLGILLGQHAKISWKNRTLRLHPAAGGEPQGLARLTGPDISVASPALRKAGLESN